MADVMLGDVGRDAVENPDPGLDQGFHIEKRRLHRREIDELMLLATCGDLGHRRAPALGNPRQALRLAADEGFGQRTADYPVELRQRPCAARR